MGLLKLFKTGKKLLGLTPVIGDFIENHKSKDGGENRMHWPKAASMIVRYIFTAVIMWYTISSVMKDEPIDKDKIEILKDNLDLLEELD